MYSTTHMHYTEYTINMYTTNAETINTYIRYVHGGIEPIIYNNICEIYV